MQLSLTAVVFCLLAGSGYAAFKAAYPAPVSEEVPLYNYSITANGSYTVKLIENELYPEGVLAEDRIYAKSLVDSVNVHFTADYTGDQEADISGNYTIEVLVQGYQTISDVRKIVYERSYMLAEDNPIRGETKAHIARDVTLDLNTYTAFADKAEQILNAKPGRAAQVLFRGTFIAQSAYGEVEEPFSYAIQLPLTNDLFSITKEAPFAKTSNISETRETVTVPVQTKLAILITACALELIVLLGLLLFTRRPTAEELYALNFKTLARKHGSRMVKLCAFPNLLAKTQIEVADLESLIKIADERQQSVYYSLNEADLPEHGLLYVPDGERHYLLRLKK